MLVVLFIAVHCKSINVCVRVL